MENEKSEIECPDCNGEGWIEEIDYLKVHSATIDVPYKYVKCEKCDGTGFVENKTESEE